MEIITADFHHFFFIRMRSYLHCFHLPHTHKLAITFAFNSLWIDHFIIMMHISCAIGAFVILCTCNDIVKFFGFCLKKAKVIRKRKNYNLIMKRHSLNNFYANKTSKIQDLIKSITTVYYLIPIRSSKFNHNYKIFCFTSQCILLRKERKGKGNISSGFE